MLVWRRLLWCTINAIAADRPVPFWNAKAIGYLNFQAAYHSWLSVSPCHEGDFQPEASGSGVESPGWCISWQRRHRSNDTVQQPHANPSAGDCWTMQMGLHSGEDWIVLELVIHIEDRLNVQQQCDHKDSFMSLVLQRPTAIICFDILFPLHHHFHMLC